MNRIVLYLALFISLTAQAHPNGTYEIDGQEEVTVTFAFIERCPVDVNDALPGGLRTLTFSPAAYAAPYFFETAYFVEIHTDTGEVYTQTDEQCVPIEDGQEIQASRNTFGGYALRRII